MRILYDDLICAIYEHVKNKTVIDVALIKGQMSLFQVPAKYSVVVSFVHLSSAVIL